MRQKEACSSGRRGRPAKTGESPEANLANDQKDLSKGGSRLNYEAGVTLIELLVIMLVLVAVAIPAGSIIGKQIKGGNFIAAGNLARQEMEKLHTMAYALVATGSSVSGSYVVTWTVETTTGSGGAEKKDITLTAKRTGTASVLATLRASIAKNALYVP